MRPLPPPSDPVVAAVAGWVAYAVGVVALADPVMAKESGMGWQLGMSGEQAMAGLEKFARLIRAEANQVLPSDYKLTLPDSGEPGGFLEFGRAPSAEEVEQFKSRWHEDYAAFRTTMLYSGPPTAYWPIEDEYTARTRQRPIEAFAECPACHTTHYPFITGIGTADSLTSPPITVQYVVRECQECSYDWRQQEPT